MSTRRVVVAALTALLMLSVLGAAGAQTKVRFILKDLDTDPSAAPFVSLIEKGMAAAGTPVSIELLKTPAGDYAQKIALMVMSGDIPDLIYFQGGDDKIAAQGLLEDLRPYVAKSKYIKNLMDPHSAARLASYPYLVWLSPPRIRVPVMRRDWFESLSSARFAFASPSVDSYYGLFKDLVAKKGAKFGICITGATNGVEELDAIFDAAFGNTSTWLKGTDGKWVYSRVTPNEKAKLDFYAKLYREGLLDPEYLTKKWDTKEQAFYEGRAGLVVGVAPGSIDVYVNKMIKAQGTDLVAMLPAKGKAQGLTPFVDLTKEPRGWAIATTSKVKDAAWSLLDFMWSPAGLKIAKLGLPGVHYIDDGKQYVITDKYSEWVNGWFGDSWNGFKPDKPLSRPLVTQTAMDSGAIAKKYMLGDHTFLTPDQYVTNWDAMTNLYKEYAADIVTGKKPISAFDEFVDKWNKAGGVAVTAYAQTVLK
jgi:putative aldouronate transport system substrate-binding protein